MPDPIEQDATNNATLLSQPYNHSTWLANISQKIPPIQVGHLNTAPKCLFIVVGHINTHLIH